MNKIYGVGINDFPYPIKVNGIKLKSYTSWISMLCRCYSDRYQSNKPTYVDCSVCTDWLYFSNFHNWHEKNYIDGYSLDKDILIPGNKIYAPESCIYIPSWLNAFVSINIKDGSQLPVGVYLKNDRYRPAPYQSRCRDPILNKTISLGYYTDANDAHISWKKYKLGLVHKMRDMLDIIDSRLYPALVNRYT